MNEGSTFFRTLSQERKNTWKKGILKEVLTKLERVEKNYAVELTLNCLSGRYLAEAAT